jgi:hypothetical protein
MRLSLLRPPVDMSRGERHASWDGLAAVAVAERGAYTSPEPVLLMRRHEDKTICSTAVDCGTDELA